MGKVSTKPKNTIDTPEGRSEQSEQSEELLSLNAQPSTAVPSTVPRKSALKKNKAWYMVRDSVETKEVRLNLADLEMREDEDITCRSPPAPGYGVKFLETPVWPGRDVDQAESAAGDASVVPDAANAPVAATSAPDAATSESKD